MSERKELITLSKDFNGAKLSFETGKLAQQADAAVLARLGDTAVLVTVTSMSGAHDMDYFPLRVDYEERFYAGGVIGGSRFIRREGRPNDEAIISGRLIDHAIRPLFANDFMDDTQVIVTVLSVDGEHSPALLGFLAASAVITISGLPFKGPIVPMRITKKDGEVKAGLSTEALSSEMDVIVSYLEEGKKVQAVEAHADIIPEAEILEAINTGAEKSKELFDFLNEFVEKVGVEKRSYEKGWINRDVIEKLHLDVLPKMEALYNDGISYKDGVWYEEIEKVVDHLQKEYGEQYSRSQLKNLVSEVQKDFVRKIVVEKNARIDGRKFDEIRDLSAEVGILERVHGSALFSRGLTQALTIVTLGSSAEKQLISGMSGDVTKRYMHHYNFPPFSTGETGRIGSTNRREIGHGLLAEKALVPVLPTEDKFPYTIRLVSEILSSNGSTSMASVCGSSLALMDAGVPVKEHVAGIGVGLFVDSRKDDPKPEDFILLTDIIGYEDFAGYMDFKMTGTRNGMTAIQMELKLAGLPIELLKPIFDASLSARMKVLDVLESAISAPRSTLNKYAPKIEFFAIDKDKIGSVIGSGGSVIKGIMEKTGTEIDIEERLGDALVSITGPDPEKVAEAKDTIIGIVTDVEEGAVYTGTVTRVEGYGAFVEILPGRDGLLHVSEFSYNFIDDMNTVVSVGDTLEVKVIGTENGKISLSKKALEPKPEGYEERPPRSPRPHSGGNGRFGGSRSGGRDFRDRRPRRY